MRRLIPLLLAALFLVSSCELSTPPPQGKLYTIQVALDYSIFNDQDTLKGTINDANALHAAWATIASRLKLTHESFLFLQEGNKPSPPLSYIIGSRTVEAYPTIGAIEEAIAALVTVTKEEDLIIFSFSGHSGEGNISLAPVFGTVTESYDVAELLTLFSLVPGRKLIILDACETGLAIPPSPNSSSTLLGSSIEKWYTQYFTKSVTPPLDLMVMSSSTDNYSYEKKDNKVWHGIFTRALLQGLGWDHSEGEMGDTLGPVFKGEFLTVDMLYSYIKANQNFPLKPPLLSFQKEYQHPMVSGGAIDMILFSH